MSALPHYPRRVGFVATAALIGAALPALAQPQGEVGEYSDAVIEGSVLEPVPIEVSDDSELTGLLNVPDGFEVSVFARDLENPRMLAVSDDGTLYATRRSVGDVIMLRDEDGDGHAEPPVTVASRAGMHGIWIEGSRVYLATVNDVYVADIRADGTFSPLERIINDLPDSGQHPNRTLAIGPDGKLYISVGSTCNACDESSPESATMLRAEADGTSRTIFASGLRNTIGFDWEPTTGAFYGIDHGTDWLGDEAQQEEFNLLEQGKQYGWPYIYDFSNFNPQDNPPEGITLEEWAERSEEPLLGYTAHSAPMQMAFYDGTAFPEEYRGDAFVAMRGSWNRRPPSGYEIVRVDFENGRPVAFEHFIEGFLIQQESGEWGYLGRPVGIAVAPDGALYVGDDSNGIIYRVAYTGEADAAAAPQDPPNVVEEPAASDIAINLVDASGVDDTFPVTSSFAHEAMIPVAYAADGDNASPPLAWEDVDGAKSWVVIMDDPDAAMPKPFVHWVLYDVPASARALREGLPADLVIPDLVALQGRNSYGSVGYTGPKPPVEDPAHHYHTQVFALDVDSLGLPAGATRDQVLAAMEGHVLAEGEIVGTFER